MKIDAASHLMESNQQHNMQQELHDHEAQHMIQADPEDVNACTEQQRVSEWDSQSGTIQSEDPAKVPLLPLINQRATKKRIGLITSIMVLLTIGSAVLLPALLTEQPEFMGTTQSATAPMATTIGQLSFSSSGHLDPNSSQGLNDTLSVSLHNLSTPALGKSYYAWLMPDLADDKTTPILLGKVAIIRGTAQLMYTHPNHSNLLTTYSRFEIAEQESNRQPSTPPLDTKALPYSGNILNIPTPGDERHFSLLDHMRHLLAKDPTLQESGLQGGLDVWLYRNSEKILEWSSAARDSWASGQNGDLDLVHRHMIRVLDYIDGSAYVSTSGDVPAGSSLLVDPQISRIGLLEVNQTQALPAYLSHVDLHLQGLIHAAGHTEAQRQLAIKIDIALKQDTILMQKVRQDAVKLAQLDDAQLKETDALALLNDMVTNATTIYAGQFNVPIGGTINGIVWIHNELQGLATMPITTAPEANI